MSLRKIFTRVKENMLENLCTEEVKKKIGRTAVKVGNSPFDAKKDAPTSYRGFFVSDLCFSKIFVEFEQFNSNFRLVI